MDFRKFLDYFWTLLDDFLSPRETLSLPSWPGGLRGAIKSAEASFEASGVSLGRMPKALSKVPSLFLKELTLVSSF